MRAVLFSIFLFGVAAMGHLPAHGEDDGGEVVEAPEEAPLVLELDKELNATAQTHGVQPGRVGDAARALVKHLDEKVLYALRKGVEEGGDSWLLDLHHGLGTTIRNLLRQQGFPWGPVALDDLWMGVVRTALRYEAQLRDESLADETAWLADKDPRVQLKGLARLKDRGQRAAPALDGVAALMTSKELAVRREAAVVLGRIAIGGKKTVPYLIQALREKDPALKLKAVRALEAVGPSAKNAVPELLKVLNQGDPPMMQAVVRALGGLGAEGKSVLPLLKELSEDKRAELAEEARSAAARIEAALKRKE